MTKVKICGLTNEDDMVAAVEAGADLLGFIFHEKSPRYVPPERVMEMTMLLKTLDVPRVPLCVGVFLNPIPAAVVEIMTDCHLQAAQIHKTDFDTLRAIHKLTDGAYYPAIQPRDAEEGLAAVEALSADESELIDTPFWLPQLMVDAYHPHLAGGTGQQADLGMARVLTARVDRLMLAGGLTADNVAETIRVVQPFAVDVSGGVEAVPGKKDHDKIRAFIKAVRRIDEEMGL